MRNILNSKKIFPIILAAAAAIGIFRLITVPHDMGKGQTDNYWVIANNLLDGKGYSLCYDLYFPFCDGARPTAMREPVPTLLFTAAAAVSGRSLEAALVVELLAYLATLMLLHHWVRSRFGVRVAWIAALFWSACLVAIQSIPQLSGDLVGTALFLGAVILFERALNSGSAKHWILTGLVLGLAALSRSVLLFMLLPWAWVIWRKAKNEAAAKRLVRIGLLVAATLITLSPWVIRNHNTFGRWYAGTSMNGYNMFRNAHPVRAGQAPHYVAEMEARAILDDFLTRHTELRGDEHEGEMDKLYMEEGKQTVMNDPIGYAKLVLWRFIPLWTNIGVSEQYGRSVILVDHLMTAEQLLWLVLLVIGAFASWKWSWPWVLTIAFHVMLYMAVVAQVRYMLTALPLIIAVAAIGLDKLLVRCVPSLAEGTDADITK